MIETRLPLRPLTQVDAQKVRQSHAQRRLWFLNQMNPEQARHNIVFRLSLAGPSLEAEKLAAAFIGIAQRHSVLRTCYHNSPEGPEQWVSATPQVELAVQDLMVLTQAQQAHRIEQILECEQQTPFDLNRGPVLRARLLNLAADRQELIYTVHHIAFDGRSQEIFLTELAQLYLYLEPPYLYLEPPYLAPRYKDKAQNKAQTTTQTQTTRLAPVALQYVDFAAWEPAYLTPTLIESHLGFWRDYLTGIPSQITFANRPRPQGPVRSGRHGFVVPPLLAARLKAAAKARGQTSFTTLITLFSLWIHYLSGQEYFLIGTDVHGRDHPALANIMGFFINQLPIQCDVSGDPTLAELLQRSHALTRAALAHRQLPFDVLVAALIPQRQPNRTPLFQVKLNYQRDQFPVDHIGEARITRSQILQDMAGFDLVLDLTHGSTGIEASLEYDQQLFSAQEIEPLALLWLNLIAHYDTLLDQPLSRLRQHLQQWENAHLQHLKRQHNHRNRARLATVTRKPRPLVTGLLQEQEAP